MAYLKRKTIAFAYTASPITTTCVFDMGETREKIAFVVLLRATKYQKKLTPTQTLRSIIQYRIMISVLSSSP